MLTSHAGPMAPKNFVEVISATAIAKAVHSLAQEVDRWVSKLDLSPGDDLVTMPVMRGAMFFYADFARRFPRSLTIVPVRTWGYVLNRTNDLVELRIELSDFNPQGKTILLVDEICDTGRTLKVLSERLLAKGAKEVKSVVLVQRRVAKIDFVPDWVGLEYPSDDWLVGYGMDDQERYRNLQAIYKKLPTAS